ncbi:unnamed protein product [Meganyctiphanes norvegica]|uniref:Uncharacterized protein n=1 Tax=Meganyctiphanes norvegica TaxID=48144 RepID=A0AAV2S489_MEGNR
MPNRRHNRPSRRRPSRRHNRPSRRHPSRRRGSRFNIIDILDGRIRPSALLGSIRHQHHRNMTSNSLRPRPLLRYQDEPTLMLQREWVDLPRFDNAQEQIGNDNQFGPEEEEILRMGAEFDGVDINRPNCEEEVVDQVVAILPEDGDEIQPINELEPNMEFRDENQHMDELDPNMEYYNVFRDENQPMDELEPNMEFRDENQPMDELEPNMEFREENQPMDEFNIMYVWNPDQEFFNVFGLPEYNGIDE